jgi:hypothetical protein
VNQDIRLFHFSGLSAPIAFDDSCLELLPIMEKVLYHWRISTCLSVQEVEPIIRIEAQDGGYQRHSAWVKQGKGFFHDPLDAVCDFIVDLIHAFVADNPDLLCLHCAAVEFEQGLVLFPNTYKAGKSTLTVKLASMGCRVFSDDVMPLFKRSRNGIALGIQPRLRIPLPDNTDQAFVDFVETTPGTANRRYRYPALDQNLLAPLGTESPIRAIVVLKRDNENPPALTEATKGHVLKDVILRNFARQGPAVNILDTLFSLVESTDCFTLNYATPAEAAELLNEKFNDTLEQSSCFNSVLKS